MFAYPCLTYGTQTHQQLAIVIVCTLPGHSLHNAYCSMFSRMPSKTIDGYMYITSFPRNLNMNNQLSHHLHVISLNLSLKKCAVATSIIYYILILLDFLQPVYQNDPYDDATLMN